MKKFALALTAAAAVVLGSAGAADASSYPPAEPGVTVGSPTATPAGDVTLTAACTPGETVTFTLGDESATAPCIDDGTGNGSATATLRAPRSAGAFTGTATGSISGALGSFTVTVGGTGTPGTPTAPTGGLPATGSDGTSTMTMVAGGILVAGLGMFGVATARRRQDTIAA